MVKKPEGDKMVESKKQNKFTLPPGKYCLVGWDMDTTGRRLVDEVCHIAAYTPSSQFSQYIMPYSDLNPSARRRHNIRVTTDGRFRVLRSNINNKVIRTKSEISALIDFLTWLEEVKGEATDGIILIFHEQRKMIPFMLLEGLHRYNLVGRFLATVKGFANGHALSEAKCSTTLKAFSLRVLARVLLDKEEELDNASVRARVIWQVAQHLGQGEQKDLAAGSGDPGRIILDNMIDVVRMYSHAPTAELSELKELRKIVARDNSFQPIFSAAVKLHYRDIQHINVLRIALAEGGVDYKTLNEAYEKGGRQALIDEIAKLKILKKEQQNDLLEILDSHFDPKRTATFPNTKPAKKPKSKKNNKTASNDDSGPVSPDTTTVSSPLKQAAAKAVKTN